MLLAEFGGPTGLEETETAGVLDLGFLPFGHRDEGHALGGGVRRLEMRERLAEQPVEFKGVCGEGGIERRYQPFFHAHVRIPEADQGDLDEANVGEFPRVVECGKVDFEKGGKNLITGRGIDDVTGFGALLRGNTFDPGKG